MSMTTRVVDAVVGGDRVGAASFCRARNASIWHELIVVVVVVVVVVVKMSRQIYFECHCYRMKEYNNSKHTRTSTR